MFLDYFTYGLYVVGTIFTIYLILAKKDYIKNHRSEVVFFIIALLLYTQYRRYFSHFLAPSFKISISTLPIHFCRVSALMTLLYLVTKNKYIKGFVFFQSGLGFLSVLFPGGQLFQMSQEWRNLTFLGDHFFLAIMPVFLIFIDDYRVTKTDFIVSMVYSLVIPLLVLPIALATDYNAYYVLDGVFIKDILGDNQFIISSTLLVLLVLYNILMWYLGKWLSSVSVKKKNNPITLFHPKLPWIVMTIFLLVGITINLFFVRPVPSYLKNIADAYHSKPVAVIEDQLVIYEGQINGSSTLFIESLLEKNVTVINYDGTAFEYENIGNYDAIYFDTSSASSSKVIIIVGGETDVETFVFDLELE